MSRLCVHLPAFVSMYQTSNETYKNAFHALHQSDSAQLGFRLVHELPQVANQVGVEAWATAKHYSVQYGSLK
jgi:hypothetical protein